MKLNQYHEALKFKNYPEGSLSKQFYDSVSMSFEKYVNKYYKVTNLSGWDYVTSKFVKPLFDGTDWDNYNEFLVKAKPDFSVDKLKLFSFWEIIKNDNRFSIEIKQFFTFLYSISFFRELTFEEWLIIDYWSHPWFNNQPNDDKSIMQILEYEYSENYLKKRLSELTIF
jgi:hypothetical protein